MGNICKHEFEQKDHFNKGYSMTEYDLYVKTGLTIRKNLKASRFELVDIKSKEVRYSGTLEEIVAISNKLEGNKNTEIRCGIFCPKKEKD